MPSFPPRDLGDIAGLGRTVLGGLGGFATAALSRPPVQQGPTGAYTSGISGASPTTILRNPHTASAIYDIGGVNAPRPKGLFYARFIRGDNSDGIAYWERGHGFLVRTVDNPTLTPKVEEINQYNKKRQVFTGYTFQPIGISLTDTADGMILRMWNDYARYYFGDFRQEAVNYAYDATIGQEMKGQDTGYGFAPNMTDFAKPDDQFYFSKLEIYQVFRNAYTLVTLVNPRITSFDPEELDYSSMDPVSYRLQIAYEAVLYDNQGVPQEIDGSPVAEVFRDIRTKADFIEVSGPSGAPITGSAPLSGGSGMNVAIGGLDGLLPGLGGAISNRSGLGGVLGSFGNFNFGEIAGTVARSVISGNTRNLASDLTMAATGNTQLATVLGMVQNRESGTSIAGQLLYGAARSGGISPAVHNVAQAAVAYASGNRLAAGQMAQQIVTGVVAGALSQGTSPGEQVRNQEGLAMTPQTYQVVNAQRPASSQIGYRGPAPTSGAYGPQP